MVKPDPKVFKGQLDPRAMLVVPARLVLLDRLAKLAPKASKVFRGWLDQVDPQAQRVQTLLFLDPKDQRDQKVK